MPARMKLITNALNDGRIWRSASDRLRSSVSWGTWISSTSSVMMIANTPSDRARTRVGSWWRSKAALAASSPSPARPTATCCSSVTPTSLRPEPGAPAPALRHNIANGGGSAKARSATARSGGQWQAWLPESVKVRPASGTNRQS
jgi:hypothetical protein